VCDLCVREHERKYGARKETRSAKGKQEHETLSTKKLGAREHECKSAKFKAQKKSVKAPAQEAPPESAKAPARRPKKASAKL
jgi:hypothetical protein